MTKNLKQLSYLYELDLKCLDTLATLIQEDQQRANSPAETTKTSSALSPGAQEFKQSHDAKDLVENQIKLKSGGTLRKNRADSIIGVFKSKNTKASASAPCSVSATGSVINDINLKDVNNNFQICPILAALSKEIEIFFKEIPENLENLQKETAALSTATTPFSSFQRECSAFLLGCFINVDSLTPNQKIAWKKITNLLRIIMDFPRSLHEIEAEQNLHNILDITDRILKNTPRFANQIAELSPKNRIILSQGEVLCFVEKIVRSNPEYEKERIQKSSRIAGSNLERLFEISNAKMESQLYQMTERKENQIRAGILEDLVDKAKKSRYTDQDWVSPNLQKENEIEIISDKVTNVDPALSVKQRFVASKLKEKELEISKLVGALERSPRMADQSSLPKSRLVEARLSNVLSTLEKGPKRYDEQTAQFLRPRSRTVGIEYERHSIRDSNELNFQLNALISPIQLKMSPIAANNRISTARKSATENPENQNRSSISYAVKHFVRRASTVLKPKDAHDAIDEANDKKKGTNLKESDLDMLSLGEMLFSSPSNEHEMLSKSSTLKESFKAVQNIFTSPKKISQSELEKIQMKTSRRDSRANSQSSNVKEPEFSVEKKRDGSQKDSDENIPLSPTLESTAIIETENIIFAPRPLNVVALSRVTESTDTIDLKTPSERSKEPTSPKSPISPTSPTSPYHSVPFSPSHQKKSSRLKASINMEDLDREYEENEKKTLPKESASNAYKNICGPPKKPKNGPVKGSNHTGCIGPFLHLNPMNSSGSTLPDLNKDRSRLEDVAVLPSPKDKAVSEPPICSSTNVGENNSISGA